MDSEIRRTLLQYVDGLTRAGVSHLPISRAPLPQIDVEPQPLATASAAASPTRAAVGKPSTLRPSVSAPDTPTLDVRPAPEPQPQPARATPAPAAAPAASTPTMGKKLLTPEPPPPVLPAVLPKNRAEALQVINSFVKDCTRCEELARTRTQTVFGVGNPHAKILFVGEAPGADEDATGEPFVGRAGKLLNDIIAACRMNREDVYICNILRCRPPNNRTPEPDECANCREYLEAQLKVVDPEYVVCWGSVAAKNLLGVDQSIGKMRGRFYEYGRAKVLCTYHPSYLLRNPAAKKDVWEDMKFLFKDMGIDLTRK